MKKLTLTQEDPVIFVRDTKEDAWRDASAYVAEQREKNIVRVYSVAYAVIVTPLKVDSEAVINKTKR
jgi:hypothetical protein